MSPVRLSTARHVLSMRVALGIAVVLVAGVGRLAVPAAAGTDDAAAVAAPPPVSSKPSTPAPTKPKPAAKPSPTSTPSPEAASTYSSGYFAASRYTTRTPMATPSPTHTRRPSSSSARSYSSNSYSAGSSVTSSSSSSGDPRSIARAMLAARGWSNQFSCLDPLWSRESGWSATAGSPSGPYGIPQANPGSKMASAGSDWMTNPRTQISWGLNYIASTYGSPCAAWSHSQSTGWY